MQFTVSLLFLFSVIEIMLHYIEIDGQELENFF